MTDLAGAIERSVRAAWSAVAAKPPMVEVEGQSKTPAARILIHRHQGGGVQDPGVLHVCRNASELPVRPIELRYAGSGSWKLFNGGESDVRVSTPTESIGVAQPGKTLDIRAPAFRVRVRTQFFDFRVEPGEPPKMESLQFDSVAELQAENTAARVPLQIGDFDCCLLSDSAFWTGMETVREELLRDIWRRFAAETGAGTLPEIHFGATAEHPVPGPGQIALGVQTSIDGRRSTLVFLAPTALGRFVRQAAGAAVKPACHWIYLVVAGEQNLSLGTLRRLKTGAVVVLNETPTLHETATGRSWALEKCDDGRWFSVGKEIPSLLELEGASMATPETCQQSTPAPLSIDSIEVRLQAVVSSGRVPFSELGRYLPGQKLPMEFSPGKTVDLYVNGKKLGTGKLVEFELLPGAAQPPKLGVQVVNWDA